MSTMNKAIMSTPNNQSAFIAKSYKAEIVRRCKGSTIISPGGKAAAVVRGIVLGQFVFRGGSLLGFERSHIDGEAVLHIRLQQSLVRVVDFLDRDDFDVGGDVV